MRRSQFDIALAYAKTARYPPCFNVNAPKPTPAFDRGNRTYYVSDERMRAFGQLSVAQRLQWVEQCAQFVRLAQAAKSQTAPQPR